MEEREEHQTEGQIPPLAAGLIAEIRSLLDHATPENYLEQLIEVDRIMALWSFDRLEAQTRGKEGSDGNDAGE